MGKLLLNVLATILEFEADVIREGTRDGKMVAKAKGRPRGKQPMLTIRQDTHFLELNGAGERAKVEQVMIGQSTVTEQFKANNAVQPNY